MDYYEANYQETAEAVADEIKRAVLCVDPAAVKQLAEEIQKARKVFFVGVGRVMMSLEAMAKRLGHLGIDVHCVGEVAEPAITAEDLLIVGSGSGCSLFPVAIARKARSLGARVAHIGSNPRGDMAQIADLMVRIPVQTKLYLADEVSSIQPMTSLFEQSLLVLGDILAKLMVEERQMDLAGLWQYHANLE